MKKAFALLNILLIVFILVSCNKKETTNNPNNNNSQSENVLYGDFLYEDILSEDILSENELIEEFLYEMYLEEKSLVEQTVRETLLEEELIEEVLLLETFYIPQNDPYRYYDGASGSALFGSNLNIDSLITKGAIGAGAILTIAAISVIPYFKPISVGVITVAKNALPYVVQGATVGTIMGAGIGATLGVTDAIDSSMRLSALTALGLATAGLITSVVFPPAILGTWGAVAAITASSIGLAKTGINTFNTYMRTDGMDINLSNLNWNQMGYTIAEKSVKGAADGFVFGAISGAVLGVGKSFKRVNGKMVLIDNSTFNPNFIDEFGRSNIVRMNEGLAPIGMDGYPVNIHHLDQTDTGAVVEMMQSVHRENYSRIHSNTGQYPSFIDRPAFNIWRRQYWIQRALEFI